MELLKERSQQYADGLISPKEYVAGIIGILANHWDTLPDEAIGDELTNKLSCVFLRKE